MTVKLTVLTKSVADTEYISSPSWQMLTDYCVNAAHSMQTGDKSWYAYRSHLLDEHQAELGVGPVSRNYYLKFPDEDATLAFLLTWS